MPSCPYKPLLLLGPCRLHAVQVQLSILKLFIPRTLQLLNLNLRICSSEQVLDECHGKESLSLCWVTPTSSLHADSADEGLGVIVCMLCKLAP